MRPNSIAVVNKSRDFRIEDLFFSTTDKKGVIKSCNQVFVDISAYNSSELLDKAHNVIRHPDMPRCVFKLLWDYLLAGKTMGAYVKNIAKTGEYYWVYALVLPIEGGFLSVRLKPTSPTLPVVGALYAELLLVEKAAGKDWRKGMEAAGELLQSKLAEMDFESYDAFMTNALHTETSLRLQQIKVGRAQPQGLYALFEKLKQLSTLREMLMGKQAFFSKLGKRISLVAINARVSASKLSGEGQTLGVVSETISEIADAITAQAEKLTTRIESLGIMTESVSFAFSTGILLFEMSEGYRADIAESTLSEVDQMHHFGAISRDSQLLLDGQYAQSMKNCESVILAISSSIREFQAYIRELSNLILSLKMGYFVGKSTAAGVAGSEQFALLLEDMNSLSDTANSEVSVIERALDDVAVLVQTWQQYRRGSSQKSIGEPSDSRMSA